MNRKIIAGAIVGVLLVVVSFITVGYPFFFRGSLAEPSVEIDSAEGKVWLDTQIVMEFRGSHSKDTILDYLQISPNMKFGDEDLKVEHIAVFPWHEGFPWAKTRVTINPNKEEIFKPETTYNLYVKGEHLLFETITLPYVTETSPADESENAEIQGPVGIYFNEKINWDERFLTVDPAEDVEVEVHNTGTLVFVSPQDGRPWKNSTTYTVTIKKGLTDEFGHQMREDFVLEFTTEPSVSVVEATPSGKSKKADVVVRMIFDRAPLPEAAESSFLVTPKFEGKLTWEDETTLLWTPTQKLPYSTEYALAIGGKESWQDPIKTHEWQFRTQDPPAFVEIQGGSNSPTTLKALASGGLGEYSYEWSTGETGESISAKVPAGETWSFSVTVTSGDQSATSEMVVKGPSLPPPPPPTLAPPAPALPVVTPGGGMKFVLSFDDSDGSGATVSGILDVLAQYGVKAIFFPTGSWAHSSGVPYIQRMLAEGHMVCNITRDHADLTLLSEAGIREQILGGAGVGTCNLLRPPYGAHNAFVDSIAASLGYSIYMWTVDPRDWSGTSVSYITNTILSGATPSGIAVLHMYAGNTLIALPGIIEGLQATGYTLSY